MNDESDSFLFHFLAICMDNASICDVLARATGILLLKKYGLKFHEENAQIWCIAHIVNLIIQALLTSLNEAEDPDIDDYYIPNKHLPFHYDPYDDDEVQQMEAEDEEFTELLHMKLENEELEGELIAKVIYISELHMSCTSKAADSWMLSSYMQSPRRYAHHPNVANTSIKLLRRYII